MAIIPFPRCRRQFGLTGYFWCPPPAEQLQRIRQLARSRLNAEQIATICRVPLSQVTAVLKVQR